MEQIATLIVELGILSTIAVLFLHRSKKQDDAQQKRMEQQDLIQQDRIKLQDERIDDLIQVLTSKMHSIDKENDISIIENKINDILTDLMYSTDSARAFFIRYHNGGHDLNNMSFLKMSMTNEIVRNGIAPFMSSFKDQFRAMFRWLVNSLKEVGIVHIDNMAELKKVDNSLYEFFKTRGVKRAHAISITNKNNQIIGFIGVEYLRDESTVRAEKIDSCLHDKKIKMETILSLN